MYIDNNKIDVLKFNIFLYIYESNNIENNVWINVYYE